MVGVVMGSQYASSFLARLSAGEVADTRGVRLCVLAGLVVACCIGVVYLASAQFAGRLLTGIAEAFIIIGAMGWGIGHIGARHAGKVFGCMDPGSVPG